MPTGPGGRTLSRDYKDVRRHTTVAAGQAFSGWVGFGAGLALGLAVALGVHLYDRNSGTVADEPVPVASKPPASAAATDDAVAEPASPGTASGSEFDFYDMLPKQEVDVPDTSAKKRDAANPAPLPTGEVVLQAGAFKQEGEADRMIARLAVYGVVAKKQRASVDDETWYRVRIGPIATVEELTALKAKLQEAEIQANPVTEIDEAPLP
jgi:cell division protein FtsN